MTAARPPRLSIGLPVYNGERYIGYTLDSICRQTFRDFELIICDNASTDGTERLCLEYAAQDARIKYFRNASNIGANQNWYRVLDLASADYFASVAHDDIYEPDYMRRCIEVLEGDPATVVCYSKTKIIDATGAVTGIIGEEVDTTSHERLYQVIHNEHMCIQLYGVMRTSALRRTKVFVGYYGCDRNTLAELALLGKLRETPEYLFLHRVHSEALGAGIVYGKTTADLMTIDPGTDWRTASMNGRNNAIILRNYFSSVARLVQSRADRVRCYASLGRLLHEQFLERLEGRLRRLAYRLRRLAGRLRLADR